jgi:hypothetical protein
MNNRTLDCLKDLPRNSILSTLSTLSHQEQREIRRDSQEHRRVRMPSVDLTKVIFELPHRVTSPRHRHHNHRGGRCQHRLSLHHHNHRLRPLKTLGFWNGPSYSPDGQRTSQWSPQTMMPQHEIVTVARAPSMVRPRALTQLHRWSGLHHEAMRRRRGQRRNHDGSQWSRALS